MTGMPHFPDDVLREIESAACAVQPELRGAHLERAIARFAAAEGAAGDVSGGATCSAPGEEARRRRLVETALFTRIAFDDADEPVRRAVAEDARRDRRSLATTLAS